MLRAARFCVEEGVGGCVGSHLLHGRSRGVLFVLTHCTIGCERLSGFSGEGVMGGLSCGLMGIRMPCWAPFLRRAPPSTPLSHLPEKSFYILYFSWLLLKAKLVNVQSGTLDVDEGDVAR